MNLRMNPTHQVLGLYAEANVRLEMLVQQQADRIAELEREVERLRDDPAHEPADTVDGAE